MTCRTLKQVTCMFTLQHNKPNIHMYVLQQTGVLKSQIIYVQEKLQGQSALYNSQCLYCADMSWHHGWWHSMNYIVLYFLVTLNFGRILNCSLCKKKNIEILGLPKFGEKCLIYYAHSRIKVIFTFHTGYIWLFTANKNTLPHH